MDIAGGEDSIEMGGRGGAESVRGALPDGGGSEADPEAGGSEEGDGAPLLWFVTVAGT